MNRSSDTDAAGAAAAGAADATREASAAKGADINERAIREARGQRKEAYDAVMPPGQRAPTVPE